MRDLYLLDPDWTHLNHGSFGACPRPVLEQYQRLQRELERQPTECFRQVPGALAAARAALAEFAGADPAGLLFMQSVTVGVNAVAHSLRLGPGDEVLATDHECGSNNLPSRWPLQLPECRPRRPLAPPPGGAPDRGALLELERASAPPHLRRGLQRLGRPPPAGGRASRVARAS